MDQQNTTNAEEIWGECLKIIKSHIPPMTFNTWFAPIKPVDYGDDTLKIELPGNFFWEWIDEHYSRIVKKAITTVIGPSAKLDYIIVEDDENYEGQNEQPEKKPERKTAAAETVQQVLVKEKSFDFETNLNSKYTFEKFIKGEGNQLARAAAVAVSENPGGTSFNPLFVYGGVGLGKTHLIQAIGNSVLREDYRKRIIYKSSDEFTVDFVESIQSNKINEFSNLYRNMDILIIDDIQFLIGKERTQDLFFHIFNTLHQDGKQIVLSSDKAPKDLKGMDDRLISRFNWGLTVDIQPPDFETRIAILHKKSELYGLSLDPEIYEYIANHITSNIRELEGCLIKLLANASLSSKDIDLNLAKQTVKEVSTNRQVNISIDVISKIVCEYLDVDEKKIRDKTRKQEIVYARQIAMFLSKKLTNSTLKTIGLHFGGRDHSTVSHAIETVEEQSALNKSFKEKIETIKNKIELSCS